MINEKNIFLTVSWLSGLLSAEIFISTGEWGVQMPPLTAENIHFLRSGSQEAALVMKLEFVNNVEILSRTFSNNLSSQDHIDIRIHNSRRAMYSIGLNNLALGPSVKAYLRSIGTPSLMYAIGTCNINSVDLKAPGIFPGNHCQKVYIWGKDVIIVPCWRRWIFLK